ncbi:MAG: hypothetical protein JNM18_18115 [Planctomycetaceae bacterium]|nr:hypothetical protein [Planctomycetaceae bacterium]
MSTVQSQRGSRRRKGDLPSLFLHRSGQWTAKIKGRTIYFGRDQAEAMALLLKEKDAWLAGKNPRVPEQRSRRLSPSSTLKRTPLKRW